MIMQWLYKKSTKMLNLNKFKMLFLPVDLEE